MTLHVQAPIDFWNPYTLAALGVLAALVAYQAARKGDTLLFGMTPPMSAGRRLSLFWSCLWRQILVMLPVYVFGLLVTILLSLSLRAIWDMPPSAAPAMLQSYGRMLFIDGIVCFVALVPLTGYAVRRGFRAHALASSAPTTFRQALLLGCTTVFWGVVAELLIGALLLSFQGPVAEAVRIVLLALGGMYVVLPRQMRRVAGFDGG
ncbi:hypothetical protein [Burkholderia guangdongensis]|uniref:hypothetical protein n=1 Tax=Burkholderia guangdongensis TaxID=1792500 RepID=UPI001FE3640C|nr:hypothetical protein [Burkholderia guangdongensis]